MQQDIVFDSVSRMSRNAQEGYKDSKMLYELGVSLVFLNEPLINTSVFDSTRNNLLSVNVETGNEAVDNFFKNPFVGTGILDDSISYGEMNKAGTMTWYHMMIPQVIGSMGLIGVCAYGFQALQRCKLIFTKTSSWSLVLGISYLGILMMSQVNPGEFCPLPFERLTVLFFILQERRIEQEILPLCRKKG